MSSPEPAWTEPEDLPDTGTVSVKQEPDDLLDIMTVSMKQSPEDLPDTNFLHLRVCEEVPPECQKRSSCVVQEEPEPPDIKEEEEEILKITIEADGDEENGEAEPPAGTSTDQMRTQAYIEYWVPSSDDQLHSSHCSDSEITEDSDEWEEAGEGQSDLNTLTSHRTQNVKGQRLSLRNRLSQDLKSSKQTYSMRSHNYTRCTCTVCGKDIKKSYLKAHMCIHTRGKRFTCTVCGKGCSNESNLNAHMSTHIVSGPKPILTPKITPLVNSRKPTFSQMYNLKHHMGSHTGGKPFMCAFCGKCFIMEHRLTRHMRSHAGQRLFSCLDCGKGFTQTSHLQEHMSTHTVRGGKLMLPPKILALVKSSQPIQSSVQTPTGGKPFMCTVCGKGFVWKNHLQRHMMTHTRLKLFSCLGCGKGFTHGRPLQEHMSTHIIRGLQLMLPPKIPPLVKSSQPIQSSIETRTGEKPYICTICGKGFSQVCNAKLHMGSHTGEKTYTCIVCGKGFIWECHLKQHMMTHTAQRLFSCLECGRGFTHTRELQKHMSTHTGENPLICTFCGRCFTLKCRLKRHMMTHIGQRLFSCSDCGKGFTETSLLQEHMSTHIVSGPQPKITPLVKSIQPIQSSVQTHTGGTQSFSCLDCGKGFTQTSHLKEHMCTHIVRGPQPISTPKITPLLKISQPIQSSVQTYTGVKPFMCTFCGISFTLKCRLKRHMKTHIGQKLFSCPDCGKGFTDTNLLQEHMNTHVVSGPQPMLSEITCLVKSSKPIQSSIQTHTGGQQPFSCLDCGKGFSQTSHLKEHMCTHIVRGPQPISSPEITPLVKSSQPSQSSVQTHTGEKPFMCTFCGECFIMKCHLKLHMMTHIGQKLFRCSDCGKGFTQASLIQEHMSTHIVSGPQPVVKSSQPIQSSVRTTTGEQQHMITHTVQKPFSCLDCGKGFTQTSLLKEHMSTHIVSGLQLMSTPKITPLVKSSKPIQSSVRTHTGEQQHMITHTVPKPFSCLDCGKGFTQTSLLKEHMITHTVQKPFSCLDCGKGFTQTSHLKEHMITHSQGATADVATKDTTSG